MAIQFKSAIIKTQTFSYGSRNMKAVYTPEIDEQFGNFILQVDEINKQAESKEVDALPLKEKEAFIKKANEKAVKLSTAYIRALFDEKDADFIVKECSGRAVNLTRVARIFYENGNENEQGNREQRRNKD